MARSVVRHTARKEVPCWRLQAPLLAPDIVSDPVKRWEACSGCRVFQAAVPTPLLRFRELLHCIVSSLGYIAPGSVAEAVIDGSTAALLKEQLRLTSREEEVLLLAVQGWPRRMIARSLQLSEETVKMHLAHIYSKAGVSSRKELRRKISSLSFSRSAVPPSIKENKPHRARRGEAATKGNGNAPAKATRFRV